MRRGLSIAFVVCLVALGGHVAEAGQLKWVGCGISKKAFMSALAEAYERQTGVSIVLEGGGATRGIRDVAAGTSDMGGSCRHKILVDEERNTKMIPVGWDALVAITHPDNPVKDISLEDLKAVLEGKITNWQDLGGPNAPIELVVRKGKVSGVGLLVRELVLSNTDHEFPAGAIREASSGPVEKRVERSPTALAFSGISSARKRNVAMLRIDGQSPTYENVAAGKYKLIRPLYLVIPKDPREEVAQFVRFATGPDGQRIVKNQGTVTLADGASLWTDYRKAAREARKNKGS
jgi:phosphate transport system substrate-binding protein